MAVKQGGIPPNDYFPLINIRPLARAIEMSHADRKYMLYAHRINCRPHDEVAVLFFIG